MGSAVPAGLKMQEEYGDDVQVLFVEVQGTPRDEMETFVWKREWMGTNAMWTKERPFDVSGVKGIPHFALLDAEGRVVLSGYSVPLHGEIEDLVEEQVKALSKPPKDLPSALKKAWRAFHKGDLAAGIAAAEEVAAEEPELADVARALATDLRARAAARVAAAERRLTEDPLGGAQQVEDLSDGLADDAELGPRVAALAQRLETPEMQAELAAAKLLAKAESRLFGKPEDRNAQRSLEKIVDQHSTTHSATRARRLLEILPSK